MTTPRIRPDMGSRDEQFDALDRGLLETAVRVSALEAELDCVRRQLVDLATARALQSGTTAKPAAPAAAAGKRHLSLISGAR